MAIEFQNINAVAKDIAAKNHLQEKDRLHLQRTLEALYPRNWITAKDLESSLAGNLRAASGRDGHNQ